MSATTLDVSIVGALAEIAVRQDLSELEVEHGGLRIRIARERHAAPAAHAIVAPTAVPTAASAPIAEHPGLVKAPLVGTAYVRPAPDARPYVEIGGAVKAGDVLLLLEAMGTFSEIVAPRPGEVTGVFVEDGSPVEFGQPLLAIE